MRVPEIAGAWIRPKKSKPWNSSNVGIAMSSTTHLRMVDIPTIYGDWGVVYYCTHSTWIAGIEMERTEIQDPSGSVIDLTAANQTTAPLE